MLLVLLSLFLSFGLKIGEVLYHIHCGASKDIGCTFALTLFVIFFPTSLSQLKDHEMWLHLISILHVCSLRVCLVAIFENCYGKQLLRTVFKNSFWCFQKQNCVWKLVLKNSFCSQKQFLFSKTKRKKTCLVELIKKSFLEQVK